MARERHTETVKAFVDLFNDIKTLDRNHMDPYTNFLADKVEDGPGMIPADIASPGKDQYETARSKPNEEFDEADGSESDLSSESVGTIDDSDADDDDNPEIVIEGQRTTTVEWLSGFGQHIATLQNPPRPSLSPNLVVAPKEHQITGLGSIEYNIKSPHKGILIGDPPGIGKTLMALMALEKAIPSASRPSVVIVPKSIVSQWVSEVNRSFLPGTIKVFVLSDPRTPFTDLLEYDIIITTYTFCMAQYKKLIDYLEDIARIKKAGKADTKEYPKRPNLSLFADGLKNPLHKLPYLVLDEAHTVKNAESLTYFATQYLREIADACIMLTGSPLDNTWQDTFALATFIRAQPLRNLRTAHRMFTEPDPERKGARKMPSSRHMTRLITFLSIFTIRRPETVINLPPLYQEDITFTLSLGERKASDQAFAVFSQAKSGKSDSVQTRVPSISSGNWRRRRKNKRSRRMLWSELFKAQQHTFHPKLFEIMQFKRNFAKVQKEDLATNTEAFTSSEEYNKWSDWRKSLAVNDNWKSSRVVKLISVFNEQRDIDPDCKVLIFDESVHFLDVVEIGFSKMTDPIQCLHFSGRLNMEERQAVVTKFTNALAPAVMLISRGAGGLGLNLTSANVVIMCGPSWKRSWEEQAYKRAHRFLQQRPVRLIRLVADCSVEHYKINMRDRKHSHNIRVLEALEHGRIFSVIA